MKEAIILSDGASSGNPGPAGIGAIIAIGDKKIFLSESIDNATNNVAEYMALIRALEVAIDNKINTAKIYIDSELLVRQLVGMYRVKNQTLRSLYNRAIQLLQKLKDYEIIYIPREKNQEADLLAKGAIKKAKANG